MAQTDQILADAAAGREVDPDLLAKARAYAASTEYRAEKIMQGDFVRPRSSAPNLQWRSA